MNEIYNEYSFFTLILLTEFTVVVVFAAFILVLHTIYEERRRKTKRVQKIVKEKLYEIISNKDDNSTFSIPITYIKPRYLVPVIEHIDERIFTRRWKQLKEQIFEKYLFPIAIQYCHSIFWVRRNWSARIFALENSEQYERNVLELANDKHPLIRLQSIEPTIKLQTFEAIDTLIAIMAAGNKITSFLYRDALLKGSSNTFRLIKEVLENTSKDEKRLACLQVFTHRTDISIYKKIQEDIHSPNLDLRKVALQILSNYPNDLALRELIYALDDENWEIRSTAAMSLGRLGVRRVIPKLIQLLSDPVWRVRLQAAMALRAMGKEGMDTLKNIDPEVDKFAYQIASFVRSSGY